MLSQHSTLLISCLLLFRSLPLLIPRASTDFNRSKTSGLSPFRRRLQLYRISEKFTNISSLKNVPFDNTLGRTGSGCGLHGATTGSGPFLDNTLSDDHGTWYPWLYTLPEFRISHHLLTDESGRGLNIDVQQEWFVPWSGYLVPMTIYLVWIQTTKWCHDW